MVDPAVTSPLGDGGTPTIASSRWTVPCETPECMSSCREREREQCRFGAPIESSLLLRVVPCDKLCRLESTPASGLEATDAVAPVGIVFSVHPVSSDDRVAQQEIACAVAELSVLRACVRLLFGLVSLGTTVAAPDTACSSCALDRVSLLSQLWHRGKGPCQKHTTRVLGLLSRLNF
jgi:hypothetical protein